MTQDITGNKATFIGFGFAGVAHYRCALPARATGNGLFIRDDKTLEVKRDIGVRNAPVIIYSNPWMDFQLAECLQILDEGGKLIIDVDDDLRACMGKKDLLTTFDEDRVQKWEAGLQAATLVTCSTQHLADTLAKRLGIITMVCPNGLDMERFNVVPFPRTPHPFVIGWSGGAGHLDALKSIVPAIEQVMDARPEAVFVSLGAPARDVLPSSLFDERFEGRLADGGWGSLYDYPAMIQQFHIGLAPALDDEFYRGKSDIRFLEYSAARVYTIGQSPTYTIPDGMGKQLTADATHDDWHDAIMEVIADQKLRYRQSLAAKRYVKRKRTFEQTATAWTAAIDRALA